MFLLNLIRRVVPIKYRQGIGLWTAQQAGRSKWLLYPYLLTLCGTIPDNLELVGDGNCRVWCHGHPILSPRDGVFTSWEVLQDAVYEKFGGPKTGDTVIDVGAYVGMFTVKSSLQVGPSGSVVAIEPSSQNIRYLQANTVDLYNVVALKVAAGATNGTGVLTISNASPCHSMIRTQGVTTETVKIDRLDNILSKLDIEKVDFIKIDAEGYELEILRGATDTLQRNDVRLAVAAYHNLPNGERELPSICSLLLSDGFSISVVKGYVYARK